MTQADLRSDLDYLRTLAEEGARAPQIGGRYYVLWGGAMGVAALLHYGVISGLLPIGNEYLWTFWAGAAVIAALGMVVFGRQMAAKPGAGSLGNRLDETFWSVGGPAMGLFTAALFVSVFAFGQPYTLFNLIPVFAFFVYGIGYLLIGQLTRNGLYRAMGFAALAFATLIGCLISFNEIYLAIGFGFFAVVMGPGLMLMRQEPKSVV